jgi:hypothetical protein
VISVSTTIPTSNSITIRPAYGDDERALARLAALDSSRVPTAPVLLAEVDGELRAALSLQDSAVVADPFYPTLDLIVLLRTHAQTRSASRARRGHWSRGVRPLPASI